MDRKNLRGLKTLLENTLAITDMFSGSNSLEAVRLERLNSLLVASLPPALEGITRAEVLRLLETSVAFIAQGDETALESAVAIARQMSRTDGPI